MPSRINHNEQSNPLFPIIADEFGLGKKIPCIIEECRKKAEWKSLAAGRCGGKVFGGIRTGFDLWKTDLGHGFSTMNSLGTVE